MHIKKTTILKYALLPQVMPRFRDLFASGFQWLATLIAYIYGAVRLLPAGHPYLQPENQGKFGIRQVIAAAANNVKFQWRHIDQILIFGVVIAGIVLLFGQIFLLLFGFLFSQAEAGMFVTPNPTSDNAFMLLDFVFGVPGFFGSCALGTPDPAIGTIASCAAAGGTLPPVFGAVPVYPFHAGLHSLLEFYSWSLLFVGILIFLYFVVIVTAETASTGVPFGARFNTAWAPIRLVVAIGLLIPIAYGLNSGQYLTLAIAKLGSSLATNAWIAYNTTISSVAGYVNPNPAGIDAEGLGGNRALLPQPQMPDISGYMAAVQLVKACQYSYMKRYAAGVPPVDIRYNAPIQAWAVKPGVPAVLLSDNDGTNATSQDFDATGTAMPAVDAYPSILEFFDYGDVVVTFGRPRVVNLSGTPTPLPEIDPLCGQITLPTTRTTPILDAGGDPAGAWHVQRQYYAMIMFEWASTINMAFAARFGESPDTGMPEYYRPCAINPTFLDGSSVGTFDVMTSVLDVDDHDVSPPPAGCERPPSIENRRLHFATREALIAGAINQAWLRMLDVPDLYTLRPEILERGWAGAGMWYNSLAGVIGQEFDAVEAIPFLSKFPAPMEEIRRFKSAESVNASGAEAFNPAVDDNTALVAEVGQRDVDIAKTLYHVYSGWSEEGLSGDNLSILADRNVITAVMHGIFGTRTLMSVRDETFRDVHPMAQLIAIGKDLVNSTLTNVLASTGFAIAGGLYEAGGQTANAGLAQAISGAVSSIAMVGLTAGFLLFYVLPFMPFLYFFFAVGTWVKTIFEAMVGVPLWALAHLRIDGEGLPGDAASNGYFLLLEIFIRPIMCIFGLVASFIIFGALVTVLHEIFDLVVDNAMGFDDQNLTVPLGVYTLTLENKRAIIDEFFFTIIYVMAVYIIGLSCFKLIDMIPNAILRWAGAGVKSFGDTYQDPAEGLTQYAAIGGYVVGERLIGASGQLGRAAGQGMGAAGVRMPFEMMRGEGAMRQAAAARRAPPP